MLDPKGTPRAWVKLSDAVNAAGGGTDQKIGSVRGLFGMNPLEFKEDEDWKWDWSGNQIRHILFGFLGGPFDTAEKFIISIFDLLSEGQAVDARNIPVLQRFLRNNTYGGNTKRKNV